MNQPPSLTPEQAAAHTWKPDAAAWEAIKRRSLRQPAIALVTGFPARGAKAISRGSVEIRTATEPVGAPIFYRDVPLIPGVGEKGEIRPLPASAIHLIQWSLRYVGESRSTVLMRDLPTCANCHSFTADGKILGMDVDGPANDKGLYSLTAIQPKTSIRNENVIRWSQYRPLEGSVNIRVGFMSQVSPYGRRPTLRPDRRLLEPRRQVSRLLARCREGPRSGRCRSGNLCERSQ